MQVRIPALRRLFGARSLYGALNPFASLDADFNRLYGGAPPTISSFTPTAAAQGMDVVITGTNFTGATSVKFGGTEAQSPFSVDSPTQITAVVPAGTTGSVSVTTPGGTVSLAGFTYLDLNTDLISQWLMGEATAATREDSIGSEDLTAAGTASDVARVAGILGATWSTQTTAAGAGFMSRAHSTPLSMGTGSWHRIICFRIDAGSAAQYIWSKDSATQGGFAFRNNNDGTMTIIVRKDDGTDVARISDLVAPSVGTAKMCDISWDGSNLKARMNADAATLKTVAGSGTPGDAGNPATQVGNDTANGAAPKDTTFGPAWWYKGRVLTDAEVTCVFNSGHVRVNDGAGNWEPAS